MRRTTTATLTGDHGPKGCGICGALQLSLNMGPVTHWCPENLDATLVAGSSRSAMPQFRVRIDDLGCPQGGRHCSSSIPDLRLANMDLDATVRPQNRHRRNHGCHKCVPEETRRRHRRGKREDARSHGASACIAASNFVARARPIAMAVWNLLRALILLVSFLATTWRGLASQVVGVRE